MKTSYLRNKIKILLVITSVLYLFPMNSQAQEGRGILFEDSTKYFSFQAPMKWTYDSASNKDALIFNGPKVSGIASKLTVRTLKDGRSINDGLSYFLESQLNYSAETEAEPVPFEGVKSSFIDQAVTWTRKVKSRKMRMIVAIGQNGPYKITFTFNTPASGFDRYLPGIKASLSSVTPSALKPVFRDASMGIAFYHLPKGFEVDSDRTEKGKSIEWKYKNNDTAIGSFRVSVISEPAMEDQEFVLFKKAKRKEFEDHHQIRDFKEVDFHLSNNKGVIFEFIVEYNNGALLNTHRRVYIQNSNYLIEFFCSGETKNFEAHLRAVYDRFMNSIDIEFDIENEKK